MSSLMSAVLDILSKDVNDYWSSTTTANGDEALTYLEDDELYGKVPDWITDGMIVYLPLGPGGDGDPETRVIDSIQNGNQLVIKNYFSAQVESGVTYEIHRLFTRDQKLLALRQAATLAFPDIHAVVRDMTTEVVDYKYEYDISSLTIYNNRPHQVLIAQNDIEDIWVAETAYEEDDVVRPTSLSTFSGYTYICTTAGTSDTDEPTWPTDEDGTVVDGTAVWTRQDTLDYSNYPMLPLHDLDITPDGLLRLNDTYDAGRKLMIVGIKPLAFSGDGDEEAIALDSPQTFILAAQAIVWLANQKIAGAVAQDTAKWTAFKQLWEAELATRKIKYPMKAPDGTFISGEGLTV